MVTLNALPLLIYLKVWQPLEVHGHFYQFEQSGFLLKGFTYYTESSIGVHRDTAAHRTSNILH